MDIDIIVTTFGSDEWGDRGFVAAVEAAAQAPAHHFHSANPLSLGAARNEAVRTDDPKEWICFLDADDELEHGYMDVMRAQHNPTWTDLFTPALRLGASGKAKILNKRDIMKLNPCPIGTLIHRKMFDEVGGFWNEPAWEDWSLFRRAVLVGAGIRFAPFAVYRANSTGEGRNSTVEHPEHLHAAIVESHRIWMNKR